MTSGWLVEPVDDPRRLYALLHRIKLIFSHLPPPTFSLSSMNFRARIMYIHAHTRWRIPSLLKKRFSLLFFNYWIVAKVCLRSDANLICVLCLQYARFGYESDFYLTHTDIPYSLSFSLLLHYHLFWKSKIKAAVKTVILLGTISSIDWTVANNFN